MTGEPSLEAVRFMNRMIKEKRYAVHPNALRCLYHLRLKRELDVRASQTRVDKTNKSDEPQRKVKKRDRQHLSKKARKALKENKSIQNEMKEAEAQINTDERASRVSLIVNCAQTPRLAFQVISTNMNCLFISIRRRSNWYLYCISVFSKRLIRYRIRDFCQQLWRESPNSRTS
jgi:hypothetical protein